MLDGRSRSVDTPCLMQETDAGHDDDDDDDRHHVLCPARSSLIVIYHAFSCAIVQTHLAF